MLPRVLAGCSLLGAVVQLAASPPQNPPPPPGWTLREGGVSRDFVLVTDQVHVRGEGPGHGWIALPADTDRATLLEHVRQRRASGENACLVLYESGRPRSILTRRTLTGEVVVRLDHQADPRVVLGGLASDGEPEALAFAPGFHRLRSPAPDGAPALCRALEQRPGVLGAEVQLARIRTLRRIPNDPLFIWQWHLRATATNTVVPAPLDLQLTSVWDQFRGTGITLGIIDTGIQTTHGDLSGNLSAALSWDFIGQDANPEPTDYATEEHGTSVAGVAAARGNNALGVAGVAYEARFAALRLVTENGFTDVEAAAAFAHRNDVIHVKNNSWGSSMGGTDLAGAGDLVESTLANAAETGRGGLGTLFVFAAGNEAGIQGDVNYDALNNNRHVIPVGALSQDGRAEVYSNPGAPLVVSAPVGAPSGWGTVTTDLVGGSRGYNRTGLTPELVNRDYTGLFGGTSAAAPMVSGVIALMLQANPRLGWRDVQEILLRSATRNDPGDPGWAVNGGGLHFHHRYGGGALNASNAVAMAQTWSNLPPATNQLVGAYAIHAPVPDGATVTVPFDMSGENLRVEHVLLRVDIDHPLRGDLAIELRSPRGMVSRLADVRTDPNGNYKGWVFASRAHWSEPSRGTWTLTVRDGAVNQVGGEVLSARLEVWGTPLDPFQLQSTIVTEAPAANHNGYFDPGETLHLRAALFNRSPQILAGLAGTLVTTNPGVTLVRNSCTWPDLPPGSTLSPEVPFELRLAKSIPCGSLLHFGLITRGQGVDVTNQFSIQTGQALDGPAVTNDLESVETPLPLPDVATTYSRLPVPQLANHILDAAELRLRLDHTAVGDLQVALRHPSGMEITLANHVGGNEPNFGSGICPNATFTVFSDRAALPIRQGQAPFTGTFRPSEPFSLLQGMTAGGLWALRISDVYDVDSGTLLCWRLRLVSHSRTYACAVFTTVPTALPIQVEVQETGAVQSSVAGQDLDGDPLTFGLLTLPAHGFLTGPHPITGAFAYQAAPGYRGPDAFQYYVSDGSNRSEPATVSIQVLASGTYTRLRHPMFRAGHGFTLEVEGLPGTTYTLEATTNFLDWVTVSTNTPEASPFPLTDPQALQFPHRFYRLKR